MLTNQNIKVDRKYLIDDSIDSQKIFFYHKNIKKK